MGHLSIAGSKMSKSLKNFQTIQDALATTYTARNMRIVFLMGRWNDGVEISQDMRKQADSWESTIDVGIMTLIFLWHLLTAAEFLHQRQSQAGRRRVPDRRTQGPLA
jgi:cysteinyl-tRNA synthetase